MAEIDNIRVPLFERLVDNQPLVPAEPRPYRTMSKSALRESVRRELQWLLNSRSAFTMDQLELQERSTIDYGIPDIMSLFYPRGTFDQQRMIALCQKTITAFEPRLHNVKISLHGYDPRKQSLTLRIDAVLIVETVQEALSFEVVRHTKTAELEVYEAT